jgi:hypothetical protein
MDTAAPASEAGLPEVADGGQHRRAPRVTGQRAGLAVLLVGVAAATVAVPPLITPHHRSPSAAPAASAAPVVGLVPAVTVSASPSPSPAPLPALASCAPATGALTGRPSCAIYARGLGNGWTATGDGLKVLPGSTVPDTKEPAMRVERSRPSVPATVLTITARTAVELAPGAKLTFRIWGGREFGTVALVSAGASSAGASSAVSAAGVSPVRINAPADRWTSWTIPLGGGRLQRITLAVEADQVPNVNRFFLDDIAIS